MNAAIMNAVAGRGGAALSLSQEELRSIVSEALEEIGAGERVLAVVPDKTRDDNTDLLFPFAAQILAQKNIAQLDALIAQGTHGPMNESEKREKIGWRKIAPGSIGKIFDHRWNREDELATLGELSAEQISELTGGLIREAVPVRLNALLSPGVYDTVLVFGATMPHEVAGFAGGAKYFFPGVAGPELTHLTHWLGALATIEKVIGRVETPTRRVIEAAAAFVPARVICFTSVSTRDHGTLQTHALFAGDLYQSFRQAAEVSSLSATHGHLIEKYGYAPLEQVREMVEGSDELRANLCVAAHLAHVSYGSARDAAGKLMPRYRITLASAVSESACRRVNMGYLDHRNIRLEDYQSDSETLVVEDAGRDLYLVSNDS